MKINLFIRVTMGLLVLFASFLFSLSGDTNDIFLLGDIKVPPGEARSGYLSVPEKDGVILYIINTPPISKGEPLFEVGKVK